MKKLAFLAVIIIASYLVWQNFFQGPSQLEALYEEPYVVVYGKDTCGWTQKYLKDLRSEGIQYVYGNLGIKSVGDELHPRMRKAGLDTSYYLLPVIDVNGQMFIRPKMAEIISAYNSYQ